MRKATLLIAVLLCFGLATAFAGPVEVEPEYEATASATWGVQLDANANGFKNSAESKIMFTFVEEQTAEYGEGTMYGYIEVDGFEVEFETPDNSVANGSGTAIAGSDDVSTAGSFTIDPGEITGKVFFGPAYLIVYNGADDAVDEAFGLVEIGGSIIAAEDTVGVDPDVALDPTTEYGGVAVGFEVPDLLKVELGLASETDWEPADDDAPSQNDEENAYVWSINAEVFPVDAVTVALVSNMWAGNATYDSDGDYTAAPGNPVNPASVGLSASYDLALSEDMTLSPELGFDVLTQQDTGADNDQEFRWEVGVGANLLWPGLGVEDSDEDFLNQSDTEVTSGVGLEVVYGSHPYDLLFGGNDEDIALNTLATKVGFYEDSGDDGFLPIVGAALIMNYNMVLANSEDAFAGTAAEDGFSDFGVGLELDADLGVVSPYVGVISEMFNVTGNDQNWLGGVPLTNADGDTWTTAFVNVGTDINVIPNTTFTIDYSSGDLLYEEDKGNQDAGSSYGYVYGTTRGDGLFTRAQAGELAITTEVSF